MENLIQERAAIEQGLPGKRHQLSIAQTDEQRNLLLISINTDLERLNYLIQQGVPRIIQNRDHRFVARHPERSNTN